MITVRIAEANKLNGDFSLYVSFPFDLHIVNQIRELPYKSWHAEDKEWEIPVKYLGTLTEKLPEQGFDITGAEEAFKKKEVVIPKNFEFKTKPFEHQLDAFMYGLENDRWLLGDEQGLGKTKQVIDIAVAKKIAEGYRHCLIICGVNTLKWNWVNEIHTHSNEGAYILGQRISRGKTVIGSNADKLTDVCRLAAIDSYFIITNIETLRDENITGELVQRCKSGEIGMIAFDESHKAKNPTSQQGKGILKTKAETMIDNL